MSTNTIPQYNQPILFKYTYQAPQGSCIKQKSEFGQILPGQDSFIMEPGSTLSLTVPETRDAGESWATTSESKDVQIKDKGFISSAKAGAQGGSGVHTFLISLSDSVLQPTPFHMILSQMGKAIAEKTLNVQTALHC